MRDIYVRQQFFTDKKISKEGTFIRFLYLCLVAGSDTKGRMNGEAAYVKGHLFTYDEDVSISDIEIGLTRLEEIRRIIRYAVSGEEYICVPRAIIYQYQHYPTKSRIPKPPLDGIIKCGFDGLFVQEILDNTPWKGGKKDRKPRNRNEIEKNKQRDIDSRDVYKYWLKTMNKKIRSLGTDAAIKRMRKIAEMLDGGYTASQLKKAIAGCKVSPYHMGENDNGKVYDDIELIVRNGINVERFIGYYDEYKNGKSSLSGNVFENSVIDFEAKKRQA